MRGRKSPSTTVLNLAKSLLAKHEGYRKHPYLCTAGKISIGIGRNLEDRGLSDDEIKYLFENDVKIAYADCKRLFRDFDSITTPARQAALIDMAMNLGGPRLTKFVNMRAAVDLRNWKGAAREMVTSSANPDEPSLWKRQVGERADRLAFVVENGRLPS